MFNQFNQYNIQFNIQFFFYPKKKRKHFKKDSRRPLQRNNFRYYPQQPFRQQLHQRQSPYKQHNRFHPQPKPIVNPIFDKLVCTLHAAAQLQHNS